jgi:hypothetical protein
VDIETAKKIMETSALTLHINKMSITGDARVSHIHGYFIVDLDLRQGGVCRDIVYVLQILFIYLVSFNVC